jgi:hypothetical protein
MVCIHNLLVVHEVVAVLEDPSHVEQVTQCVVDSTKILGYVTVEYYRLYYSNIRSYSVEYISRYSDSAYAAV